MEKTPAKAFVNGLFALTLLSAVGLTGCAVVPIPMNTQVGVLDVKERFPLKAAIYVPDPPGLRIFYSHSPSTFPNKQFPASGPTGASKDVTEQYTEELWPWGRELMKASQEALSQIFAQVTVVRQMPETGQFDIVFQPTITEIHTDYYGGAQMWMELTMGWALTVADNKGAKILGKKGVQTPQKMCDISINKSAFRSQQEFARDQGECASEALAMVVKEWVQKILASKDLHDYITQFNKS